MIQVQNNYTSVVGDGDITSEIMFPYPRHTIAEVSSAVECPTFVLEFLEAAIQQADTSVNIRTIKGDEAFPAGSTVVHLEGNGRAILTAWQVAVPLMELSLAVLARIKEVKQVLEQVRIGITHRLDLSPESDKIIKYTVEQAGGITFGSRLDEIIYISLEHVHWVGDARRAAEKAIAEAGDIRKIIKIVVEVDNIDEAISLLDLQIDYVWCRGMTAEEIKYVGRTTKGWLHFIIDESIPLEEAKTLRDSGVRLYALDLSGLKVKENSLSLNFIE
ncbi:MAG: hypothetical protein ACE5EE_09425 [Fidelibacterota bacterium]